MIKCAVCAKELKLLTASHLKSHQLTLAQYVEQHPGAKMTSDETLERYRLNAQKNNAQRDYSGHGEKIAATKQARKLAGVDYGEKLRGRALSAEQREITSTSMKQHYANAEHWATGTTLSQATRDKISKSLHATTAPIKAQRELIREAQAVQLKLERQAQAEQKQHALELKLAEQGLSLVSLIGDELKLRCACSHEWSMTKQYIDPCRIAKLACRSCTPKLTTSAQELELYKFVKSLALDAEQSNRVVLGGKELDVYVPSKHVAFEFNGLYWHSELVRGSPKHLLWKQQHAYKQGVQVYHIFEDEWRLKRHIVESRIAAILGKTQLKADARKLACCKLTNAEKKLFLASNHLQGDDVSGIRYGLKDASGEVLACMTFKKTSYVKGGDGSGFELNRFAVKAGYQVRGAASRLLSAFVREHKPNKLISYADRRWSFGNLYSALGFSFVSHSPPSYWYMQSYKQREHRSVYMKSSLVEAGYDEALTEWEIMQARGYDRVWDCGTLKYELKLA